MYGFIFLLSLFFAIPSEYTENKNISKILFGKINEERTKRGMNSLAWNSKLESAASLHASEMAINNFFSHYNSVHKKYYSPSDRISYYQYNYKLFGENNATQTYSLNILPSDDAIASKFVTNWVNSSIHNKIMFTEGFKEAAISIVSIRREKGVVKYYAVMNFGTQK